MLWDLFSTLVCSVGFAVTIHSEQYGYAAFLFCLVLLNIALLAVKVDR